MSVLMMNRGIYMVSRHYIPFREMTFSVACLGSASWTATADSSRASTRCTELKSRRLHDTKLKVANNECSQCGETTKKQPTVASGVSTSDPSTTDKPLPEWRPNQPRLTRLARTKFSTRLIWLGLVLLHRRTSTASSRKYIQPTQCICTIVIFSIRVLT